MWCGCRTWKKMPKQDGFIASISLDAVANGPNVQFIRWQVHGDWVQQVRLMITMMIRSDHFLVPVQCTGNWSCFPRGKRTATATQLFFFFFFFFFFFSPVCSVFVFVYHRLWGLVFFFTVDEYGIFNVRTNLSACCTHERGSGTNKSAEELTPRDRKTVPHPAPPRDRTQGLQTLVTSV